MINFLRHTCHCTKSSILKYKLALQGKNIRFLKRCTIDKYCTFEGHNSLGYNSIFTNCQVGNGTYIGDNVRLVGVSIGRFCSLGSRIYNTLGNHPTSIFVSTHPAFFSTGKAAGFTFSDRDKYKEFKFIRPDTLVQIGNDVWIGDNVTIKDGITIGDGAIIGANSFVTKDIEPYSINVGTPAKIVRYRFPKEDIEFLLELKWWNNDFEWIKKKYNLFENIDLLKQHVFSNKEKNNKT